jgi:DNA-binding NarL/FixJ family response regulator
VRFVVCDDHRLFIEPFAAALGMRGHEVLVVPRPEAVVRTTARYRPDLCVVDLKFPGASGLDLLADLRRADVDCRVVVLSGSTSVRDAAAAAAAGAAGFLRKDQPMATLFSALERIAAGAVVAPAPLPRRPQDSDEHAHARRLVASLTQRERDVLHRLLRAEDTLGIAKALGVAPSTARTHLQNVLFKLGVHNRLQAVALVVAAGVENEL